jgi:CRP-like cAMP-binding protein
MQSRPSSSSAQRVLSRAFEPGPTIVAVPFRTPSGGRARALLSPHERDALAQVSAHVAFRKGEELYREGEIAEFLYILISGYVRTERAASAGPARVTAFRSGGDLVGLAAEGHYLETARAIATCSAYRVPLGALESLLRADSTLGLRLLCKLASVVAAAQRHAMILACKGAVGRLAMFLDLMEQGQRERGWDADLVFLPMSRADIASHIGLSVEAVSRAFSTLEAQGAVSLRGKRQLRVTDRRRLRELIVGHLPKRHSRAP